MEYQSADSLSTCLAFHVASAVSLFCLVQSLYIISEKKIRIVYFECAVEEAHT